MSLEQSVQSILEQVKTLRENPELAGKNKLPGEAYFLPDKSVLCLPRGDGDARYPYSHDGFNLWAYASGVMCANESTFVPFLEMPEGSEPKIAFFAGLEREEGGFEPVSLLGVPAQLPNAGVKRYTVFSPKAAYYITETEQADFAVRVFVTEQKEIFFSLYAQRK